MALRPASSGIEIEAADDFVVNAVTTISSVTFTGLVTGSSPVIGRVRVKIYRVFPLDSVSPTDGKVPTRANSPSDVEFVDRDSAFGTLTFTTTTLASSFTAANSVLNGINPIPNQTTGGEGAVAGREVQFKVTFATPVILPANHYFLVPQVQVTGGEFYWLSSPKPNTITPFTPDLQVWIRNSNLDPDWLRVGTDVVGGATPPTFNGSFSLTGNAIAAHDFNADGRSDILWRDTAGDATQWFMAAGGGVQSGESLGNIPTAWSVVGSRDFNGDGTSDILWRDTSGDTTIWFISNGGVMASTSLGNIPTAWSVAGTGDFNGDGSGDILWHDTGGDTTIWLMKNGSILTTYSLGTIPTIWQIAGTGDFNGDGTTDILWHDAYGDVTIWIMNAGSIAQGISVGNLPTTWSIVGTGDFDGDGITDILWRDTVGDVLIWLMNANGSIKQQEVTGYVPTQWSVTETGDYNGDGKSDIAWLDTSGNVMTWLMNGFTPAAIQLGNVGTAWSISGANSD